MMTARMNAAVTPTNKVLFVAVLIVIDVVGNYATRLFQLWGAQTSVRPV